MLDVLELEKTWSKYHFKKILPLYIVSFVTAGLIGVSIYFYIKYPDTVLNLLNQKTVHEEKLVILEINKTITPTPPNPKPLVQTSPRNILEPSFNFMYNLEDYLININNQQKVASISEEEVPETDLNVKKTEPKKPSKPKPKPKKVAKLPAEPKTTATVPQKSQAVAIEPVQSIIIGDSTVLAAPEPQQPLLQVASTNTSEDELRSVIKRFNNNKNPALSLFLSKKYYENGNFKESYVYAKETYNLNPNIEDGVLLYAQSAVKLGKKDDAIAKLQLYIKNSGSIKAKTLLNEIQKGTFK